MSNYEKEITDEVIPAGVVDKILKEALAQNRLTNHMVVEPYVCTVPLCGMTTDNPPVNGVCRSCQLADNSVSEPFWIVSRAMRWMQTPSDLIEVLTSSIALPSRTLEDGTVLPGEEPKNRTPEELVEIARTPEGRDVLCALWDAGTRYPAFTVAQVTHTVDNPRLSEGFEFQREWIVMPEDQWVYWSRSRPKTAGERAVEAQQKEDFYRADDERRRVAARKAAITVLERSLEEARKLGVDTDYID